MAARGLVNGRSPLRRSGRDLVFRCYPPELLSPHKKTEADLLGQPLNSSARMACLFLSFRLDPEEHCIQERDEEEGGDCAEQQASHYGHGHRAEHRVVHERNHSEDGGH